MSPAVSVVVATYDRPALLAEALASVQQQTYADFECVVVDDAGRTPATVPDDSRFRVVRLHRNVGCAAARNVGIAEADGSTVTFLDDDDLYAQDRLESGLRGLDTAEVTVVHRFSIGERRRQPGPLLNGDCRDMVLNTYTPHLGQVTLRRKDLLPLDPTWTALEDVEWWLRTAHALKVHTEPCFSYGVRTHDGVRAGNGAEARLASSLRILDERSSYFATHRRARAFRHERVAAMHAAQGQHVQARDHLRCSLAARPDAPNLLRYLAAALRARS